MKGTEKKTLLNTRVNVSTAAVAHLLVSKVAIPSISGMVEEAVANYLDRYCETMEVEKVEMLKDAVVIYNSKKRNASGTIDISDMKTSVDLMYDKFEQDAIEFMGGMDGVRSTMESFGLKDMDDFFDWYIKNALPIYKTGSENDIKQKEMLRKRAERKARTV